MLFLQSTKCVIKFGINTLSLINCNSKLIKTNLKKSVGLFSVLNISVLPNKHYLISKNLLRSVIKKRLNLNTNTKYKLLTLKLNINTFSLINLSQ